MATLAAYLDDSFEKECGLYVIAGYVADVEMWDRSHQPAWNEMLRSWFRPVSEIKASDISQCAGPFRDWNRGEADNLYIEAVRTTLECCGPRQMMGFGAAVHFQRAHMADFKVEGFKLALFMALEQALRIGGSTLGVDDTLQVVFDEKPKFTQFALDNFEVVHGWLRHSGAISADLPAPMFGTSVKVSALQAADVFAYEVRKEAKGRIEAPPRPVRKSLQELVTKRDHYAEAVSWETVLSVRDRIREGRDVEASLSPRMLFCTGEEWRHSGQWPYTSEPHAD